MLCDLRGDDSSPFGGWGPISGLSWLISVNNDFRKRAVHLAKRKLALLSDEEAAEEATLTKTKEVLLL